MSSGAGACSIAVIGLGNPIMGDDGFGLAVLDRLTQEWEFNDSVDFVDGGTWGLSLLPVLESHDHVLLLDAVKVGREPGTIVLLQDGEIPRRLSTKISPHQVDVLELLALAELRGGVPRNLIVLGVEPAVVELQATLSSEVEAAVDQVVALAVDRLMIWGADCALRPLLVA